MHPFWWALDAANALANSCKSLKCSWICQFQEGSAFKKKHAELTHVDSD